MPVIRLQNLLDLRQRLWLNDSVDLDLLKTYDFTLPPELIAQSPALKREDAKLLVVRRNPTGGLPQFEDLLVSDLPDLVKGDAFLQKALWLRNVTKVIPARFYVHRQRRDGSGEFSRHEMVFLEQDETNPKLANAIIRGSKKFSFPETVLLEKNPQIKIRVLSNEVIELESDSFASWKELLMESGEMPLPPYILNRDPSRDKDRYQSVWAKDNLLGSVAAPTASLHFSHSLNSNLESLGVKFSDLCLHVGLGTFEPVRHERLSEHKIHSEKIFVEKATLQNIKNSPQRLCLGTTALRTLESLDSWELDSDFVNRDTQIFIKPGYDFKYCDALWTNFHLPESTLFVLIAAFAGSLALAQEAYQHAIQKKYRFFSYGDATLWL